MVIFIIFTFWAPKTPIIPLARATFPALGENIAKRAKSADFGENGEMS